MGTAYHPVITEEGDDFPDRVVKFFLCLDRHAVISDLQCEGEGTDDHIRTDQRAFRPQTQI